MDRTTRPRIPRNQRGLRTHREDQDREVRDVLDEPWRMELLGFLLVALAFFLYLGLYSRSTGVFGEMTRKVLLTSFGETAVVPVTALSVVAITLMARKRLFVTPGRLVGLILFVIIVASVYHLGIPEGLEFQNGMRGIGGGLVGASVVWVTLKAFGESGRTISLIVLSVAALILTTRLSIAGALYLFGMGCVRIGRILLSSVSGFSERLRSKAETASGIESLEAKAEQPEIGTQADVDKTAANRYRDREKSSEVIRTDAELWPHEAVGDARAATEPKSSGTGQHERYEQTRIEYPQPYQFPPTSLLRKLPRAKGAGTRDASERAEILEETLESFGVNAKVVAITRGPMVTRFELQPAPGVKVSRIVALTNDIALSLAAPDVRIEAPVPGKAVVGVEVPNLEVSTVGLREVLETREFAESTSPLTIVLGKDITGKPIVSSLERLMHLLIAGATGSGKSVCLNSIISSILFKAKPDQVRFVLIDPKKVELSHFNGIPHLLLPVVTDPRKAATCLKWVVEEMEKRYELFASNGVREIRKYHEAIRQGRIMPAEELPYIIVVIDELADLMMVSPVEVEDSIHRLAQMARASGIHLVVATQRPSVDVITGVIKANIPSRIAFSVSSQVDSRTILDMGGAEKLIGRGDMLFLPVGATKPTRVQGAFVSDTEVEELVAFIARQGSPDYQLDAFEEHERRQDDEDRKPDPLLPEAIRVILEHKQASVSLLQRRLKVGYSRAARIMDELEERGFVGPFEGSKPRDVLITPEEYRRLFGRELRERER